MLWAWVLLLALSAAGFAGSVWYSGGMAATMELVTTADYKSLVKDVPFLSGAIGGDAATLAAVTAEPASKTTSGVPASGIDDMFALQMSSQTTLSALAEGRVRSIQLGKATVESETASVPFNVEYVTPPSVVPGKLYFAKSGGVWRVTRPDVGGAPRTQKGAALPSRSDVATATSQQTARENQRVIADGILGGGFATVSVYRVSRTDTGVSVDLRLSGGTWVVGFAKIGMTRRVVATKTYWLFTSIDEP